MVTMLGIGQKVPGSPSDLITGNGTCCQVSQKYCYLNKRAVVGPRLCESCLLSTGSEFTQPRAHL